MIKYVELGKSEIEGCREWKCRRVWLKKIFFGGKVRGKKALQDCVLKMRVRGNVFEKKNIWCAWLVFVSLFLILFFRILSFSCYKVDYLINSSEKWIIDLFSTKKHLQTFISTKTDDDIIQKIEFYRCNFGYRLDHFIVKFVFKIYNWKIFLFPTNKNIFRTLIMKRDFKGVCWYLRYRANVYIANERIRKNSEPIFFPSTLCMMNINDLLIQSRFFRTISTVFPIESDPISPRKLFLRTPQPNFKHIFSFNTKLTTTVYSNKGIQLRAVSQFYISIINGAIRTPFIWQSRTQWSLDLRTVVTSPSRDSNSISNTVVD